MVGLIDVVKLRKAFGDLVVFDGLDLSIGNKEIVALMGPSGCGKSTLLRIIAGLERPDSGHIYFKGREVKGPTKGIAYMFQRPALLPWKNVLDNVALPLRARGMDWKSARELAAKFLEMVGLSGFEKAYPDELSGGMATRAELARALATEPEVLLLDEPLAHLDPLTAENLRIELLRVWLGGGGPSTMVLVTHSVDEAVFMATRVVVLTKRPAKVIADLEIDLGYPRNRRSREFREYVDKLYELI